jgi:hypothetical protein
MKKNEDRIQSDGAVKASKQNTNGASKNSDKRDQIKEIARMMGRYMQWSH